VAVEPGGELVAPARHPARLVAGGGLHHDDEAALEGGSHPQPRAAATAPLDTPGLDRGLHAQSPGQCLVVVVGEGSMAAALISGLQIRLRFHFVSPL